MWPRLFRWGILLILALLTGSVSAKEENLSYKEYTNLGYSQLKDKYLSDHPGKGKYGDLWEPIPIQSYWDPIDFYEPPQTVKTEVSRGQCLTCHKAINPGLVKAWQESAHANLEQLRNLSDQNPRAYKKDRLAQVEANLVKRDVLNKGEKLSQVGCIDCHGGPGKESIKHNKDLKMPNRAACGTCHTKQFAEAESEKLQDWPQDQWGQGHPSHAVDWEANIENKVWAGMPQREVAQGCDMCHYQQQKCDGCHTRHEFSVVEARKPEACSTCHNGVDHNEFENYMLSKHGTIYRTTGKAEWNFQVPLKKAIKEGNYTAPTCQYCHFEFKGQFSHNLVRKVRWGFNPQTKIAENLDHPWFKKRLDAWVRTCQNCHSPRFARRYLKTADKGTIQGLEVKEEAENVLKSLYEDGLLVGQANNRPTPPEPIEDGPGKFFQLFWARDNNPSEIERIFADMWEHDLIKHYKGLFHMNPGGFTYTEGWSPLLRDYTKIQDEATRLREAAQDEGTAGPTSDSRRLISTPSQATLIDGGNLRVWGAALMVLGLGLLVGLVLFRLIDRKS